MGIIVKAIKSLATDHHSETDSRGTPEGEHGEEIRRGSAFCGCMDMRMTVIVLSALGIALQGILIGTNQWIIDGEKADTNDDDDIKLLNDLSVALIVISCISIYCLFLAMLGGIRFDKRLILPNALFLPISVIASIALNYWVAGEVSAHNYGPANFISPLIGFVMTELAYLKFYKEVTNGILTEENYPNAKQCCCV